MLDRAVVDGLGRRLEKSLFQKFRDDDFGIVLGAMAPELADKDMRTFLSPKPLGAVALRHTIGLADPITSTDIAHDDRVDDGLPEKPTVAAIALQPTSGILRTGRRTIKDFELLGTCGQNDRCATLWTAPEAG